MIFVVGVRAVLFRVLNMHVVPFFYMYIYEQRLYVWLLFFLSMYENIYIYVLLSNMGISGKDKNMYSKIICVYFNSMWLVEQNVWFSLSISRFSVQLLAHCLIERLI